MKKHAYLIIAHNEPDVLNLLLTALDDSRNDVFIHFDQKWLSVPKVKMDHARVYIIEDRIDVRWGDMSQIKVELLLFETAYKNEQYLYYHLISGVDIPIKSQDYIHEFFELNEGKEFIGFSQGDISHEIKRKVNRFHLWSSHFKRVGIIGKTMRIIRSIHLKIQEVLSIERNIGIEFKKGANWVSVTSEFVEMLLSKKQSVLSIYHHTFCSDEIFKQTLCWDSVFKEKVYDIYNSRNSSKRMIQWVNNEIVDWREEDIEFLISSSGIFARKFSKENIAVAEEIIKKIK